MQNNGKRFEQNFQDSCEADGILCVRLVDSNKFGFGEQSRFTPKNIADFICHDGSALLIVEAKSTVNTSISFNQPCDDNGNGTYMIKPSQVRSLMRYIDYPNVYPLLVLDYADRANKKGDIIDGGTYAIHIKTFVEWTKKTPKKSINKEDAEQIGVKVDRFKKKVNYSYNIKGMLGKVCDAKQ